MAGFRIPCWMIRIENMSDRLRAFTEWTIRSALHVSGLMDHVIVGFLHSFAVEADLIRSGKRKISRKFTPSG